MDRHGRMQCQPLPDQQPVSHPIAWASRHLMIRVYAYVDLSNLILLASPDDASAWPRGASCGCHGESRYQRRTMNQNAICWRCATLTWRHQPVDFGTNIPLTGAVRHVSCREALLRPAELGIDKHCPVGRRENRPFCPAAVWGFARCPLGTAALQVANMAAACTGCVLEAASGIWTSFCLHLDPS